MKSPQNKPPLACTTEDSSRYSRQIALQEIGLSGQRKLSNARVLIIGAGGLGSPAALYLAAAGIGHLGLVDDDRVALSNLQRQILYTTPETGELKVEAATQRLSALNPQVRIEKFAVRLNASNISDILSVYDWIIDGTDNFESRYLINDKCIEMGKPLIYAAVQGFEAQVSVFGYENGPCYRCLFPQPPPRSLFPNCSVNGVLGVLPGLAGTLQATEVIKLILGIGTSLSGRLLVLDALSMRTSFFTLNQRTDCAVCQSTTNSDRGGASKAEKMDKDGEELTSEEFNQIMKERGKEIQLVDVRTREEYAANHLEGAILIPLQELEERFKELNPEAETILYCHAGVRSLSALYFLKCLNFPRVMHLKGGLIRLQG